MLRCPAPALSAFGYAEPRRKACRHVIPRESPRSIRSVRLCPRGFRAVCLIDEGIGRKPSITHSPTTPAHDIRQYMSYKIVVYALMNHINKDCEINVPPSPSLTPSSLAMSAPQRLTPDQLPNPWLLDTESLLSELGRVRGLALNIPAARNDILGPINSVIDALWDLEERLRYCFHLHCEAQRSFAKKHANSLPANQIPKQHRPAESRTATVRRRHSA
jgi:hypothetical protein